jgi:hypothetical protein
VVVAQAVRVLRQLQTWVALHMLEVVVVVQVAQV